ncbi:rhodanese-like domain-containing protein [Dethiosulfatarculus sandiegensis]|uniref:Sulfurtransferase n=1 Tax=Dethiosulfatarculus sandiegensis TaxID=1429043 RepID=A0A0D2GH28_9BACT|nr:rhodanese-like domain-containing protein [Dethiosulfatarculus sandiegensis]KIX14232.1 sulfurtransferase [Dethiosulfatarculus sandiegensis]
MKWRQFLTPVKSVTAEKAKELLQKDDKIRVLDVRQPKEYERGHISGAKLIPIGELNDRLDELRPEEPYLVYCAIGGRSRVAAQMLSGKGFANIYNLSGGFKAWNGWTGFGDYEKGLEFFEGAAVLAEALEIALGMETALREFYQEKTESVSDKEAKAVFKKLAGFEKAHEAILQKRLAELGRDTGAADASRALEGGMTTSEYMEALGLEGESVEDALNFAMFVEAQAMDLYARAADRDDQGLKDFFLGMAKEEKNHIDQLANLMEALV